MKEKIMSQKNSIIAGVVVVFLVVGGYFWYSMSISESTNATAKVNSNLFNSEVKKFYMIKGKINLDDTFMKGKNENFFNQLKSYTQDIPFKEPAGRSNPFVPYAAP